MVCDSCQPSGHTGVAFFLSFLIFSYILRHIATGVSPVDHGRRRVAGNCRIHVCIFLLFIVWDATLYPGPPKYACRHRLFCSCIVCHVVTGVSPVDPGHRCAAATCHHS